ncbi:MAG: formylglycine-generating enzyme family protein, partial [candidate division WOR-3 bacterium]|nr:formylglycine-generating enzyme family protein [candidate division WOR-3 bacterium]
GLTYKGINDNGYSEYINKKDGTILVYIPAGDFIMGNNDGWEREQPEHKVYLDGYYLSKYEITNKQYKKFCDETGREYPGDLNPYAMDNYFTGYPDYPVDVTWSEAKAYCDWAGLKLPTEAQWEKSAKGTDERKYPWGNRDPDSLLANFGWIYIDGNDGYSYTSPVGAFPAGKSPYGLMDMAGNVSEWCNDWYGYYRSQEQRNPMGPNSGKHKVSRGGAWHNNCGNLRTCMRYYSESSGIRPALY